MLDANMLISTNLGEAVSLVAAVRMLKDHSRYNSKILAGGLLEGFPRARRDYIEQATKYLVSQSMTKYQEEELYFFPFHYTRETILTEMPMVPEFIHLLTPRFCVWLSGVEEDECCHL